MESFIKTVSISLINGFFGGSLLAFFMPTSGDYNFLVNIMMSPILGMYSATGSATISTTSYILSHLFNPRHLSHIKFIPILSPITSTVITFLYIK